MSRWVGAVGLWLVALMGSVPAGAAAFQNGSSDFAGGARAGAVTSALRVLNATRVEEDLMEIDGRAGEDAWSSAHLASDFVQFETLEGAPASERTERGCCTGPARSSSF